VAKFRSGYNFTFPVRTVFNDIRAKAWLEIERLTNSPSTRISEKISVVVHCNTQSRMQALNSLKRKVAFYGAFADPAGIPRLNKSEFVEYKGCVEFSTQLPQVYAGTRILVDMTNAAFINNCSTKPICCFPSGGFSLFDCRPDPCAHLGAEIEKVMFKSFEELNAKIDYFLTHERERESLADHLKDIIQRKCDRKRLRSGGSDPLGAGRRRGLVNPEKRRVQGLRRRR
jgi:hypothetical protein